MSRVRFFEGDDFLNEVEGMTVPTPRKGETVTTPGGTYVVVKVSHVFGDGFALSDVTLERKADGGGDG
jgi:hypothetical protein